MTRTPSQTVGPFFHEAMRWEDGASVARAVAGESVTLRGRVLDGAGAPVPDAIVEAWQADPPGLGRVLTGEDGGFGFRTAKPGGTRPCLDVLVFARGLLKPVRTRVYLAPLDEARADPALAGVRASPRIPTLVATIAGNGEWKWDIRLQGEGETMFFAG